MYYNTYYNNIQNPQNINQQHIVKVNFIAAAKIYNIEQNSTAMLLYENTHILYVVQTDGVLYNTINTFQITHYIPADNSITL